MTEPTYRHQELAAGRWSRLSLAEQLGNVGSEVGRMRRWHGKDERLAAGMLVLGSQMGLIFGTLCSSWFPGVLDP